MTRESNVCFGPSAELVWLPRDVAQVLEAVILEDQLFAIHLRIWKRPLPGDTGLTLRPERDAMQDRERVREQELVVRLSSVPQVHDLLQRPAIKVGRWGAAAAHFAQTKPHLCNDLQGIVPTQHPSASSR